MNSSCEICTSAVVDEVKTVTVSDRFSWRRVGMIAKFYFPVLRKQIICMPLVVMVCVLVMSYKVTFASGTLWLVISSLPASLMFLLSPIALSRRDCRFLSNQLPVLPSEKLVFLMLYFCVFIMLVVSGGTVLTSLLLLPLSDKAFVWLVTMYSNFEEMFGMSVWNPLMWPAGCFFQLCVLYGVISAKKNRMVSGFLWLLAAFVVYQILCGISGFIIGIIFASGMDSADAASFGAGNLPDNFMHVVFKVIIALMTLGTCTFTYLIYRKLKYHGF